MMNPHQLHEASEEQDVRVLPLEDEMQVVIALDVVSTPIQYLIDKIC
jgi:hypothetical protein